MPDISKDSQQKAEGVCSLQLVQKLDSLLTHSHQDSSALLPKSKVVTVHPPAVAASALSYTGKLRLMKLD
jgi:hypothetical protein